MTAAVVLIDSGNVHLSLDWKVKAFLAQSGALASAPRGQSRCSVPIAEGADYYFKS